MTQANAMSPHDRSGHARESAGASPYRDICSNQFGQPNPSVAAPAHLLVRLACRIARIALSPNCSLRVGGSSFDEGFCDLVEVLRRLRNGGQQFVRVEHVHVNDGGQAVIGNAQKSDRPATR